MTRWVAVTVMALWVGLGLWHSVKPLPDGLAFDGPPRAGIQAEFLADLTWVDERGHRRVEHRIFERKLAMIRAAERLIVADQFLFNDFAGDPDGADLRPLSAELTAALVERKQQRPTIRIIFITDPINTLYGGVESAHLNALREAGIEVVETRLERLRDSNPAWSGLWRLCCQWAGNASHGGWLPNPVGEQKVGLRTWLRMANFKANHRKTLIVDRGDDWLGLVSSANPHDASSAHGNVAVLVNGPAALDLLATEQAIAAFSDPALAWPAVTRDPPAAIAQTDLSARVLSEAAIRDAVIAELDRADDRSQVDLAMFYLAHRGIIRALVRAQERGAFVRVLLDPNEHAFGREKNGVPNRSVASELYRHGIPVRWCRTSGEQCHSKIIQIQHGPGERLLIAGSANFTRRNLDNLNPETAVLIRGPVDEPALAEAAAWFDQRWGNGNARSFSLPYPDYADERRWRYWQYRLMEASGLSTF
jgi:phosphatidylserine/phosphatidylglycerophosphate/cardiolipin synthase-like enzyme